VRHGLLLSTFVVLLAAPSSAQALGEALSLARDGITDYRSGSAGAGANKLERASRLLPSLPSLVFHTAQAHAIAGDAARAVRSLDRLATFGLGYHIDTVSAFATLSGRPDFAAVSRRFAALREPVGPGAVAFTVDQRDLQPESIAFDPADGSWYMGSIYRQKIVRIRSNGVVEDFVSEREHGLMSILGMKLHPARRELWANACNLGDNLPTALMDSATVGRASIFRLEIPSGRMLDAFMAGSDTSGVCFNDLAIAPNGDVFATAGPGGVYRLNAATGTLSQLAAAPDLLPNGIALSPDGRRLYVANAYGAELMDMTTGTRRAIAVPAGGTLAGIDGLYVHRNTLVGIQNGIAGAGERVVQAFLNDAGDRAVRIAVHEANSPQYADPTTGTIVGDTLFYVATTQLRIFDEQGRMWPAERLRDQTVLALPLMPGPRSGIVVAHSEASEVAVLDPVSFEERGRVPTGANPHEIAVSPDGRRAYVADADATTVTVVDIPNGELVATFQLGDGMGPHDLAVSSDGTVLWVTCAEARVVLELDATSGQILRRYDVEADGAWMLAAAHDQRTLVTANLEGGGATLFDRSTGERRVLPLDSSMIGVAVTPDSREIWLTSVATNAVIVIDAVSGDEVTRFPSGGNGPVRVRFTTLGEALVVNAGSREITVFDTERRTLLGRVPTSMEPKVIAVSPDGRHAAVSHPDDDQLSIIDIAARRVIRTVPAGPTPDGVAWGW
jgi:DNA-binding beta-propeller fold protein YncE